MRKYAKLGGRLAIALVCLVAGYTLMMLVVYAIPDSAVEGAVTSAVGVLAEEGNMPGGYATYFWHNSFGITDNLTDKEMFLGLLRNGRSVVDAAMRTDYPRYWHGYAVFLRPLSTVLSIINLRYLNMMLMTALLFLCYHHCRVQLGGWTAFALAGGLVMGFILIAPFCFQYATVTYLTLVSSLLLLTLWKRLKGQLPMFFLVLGSLTCFLDFLTFPVLALGYALLCCLLLSLRDGQRATVLWKRAIGLSAVWLAGYALTWLSKAVLGNWLTDVDVLGDVLSQVALRTTGSIETAGVAHEVTLMEALSINFESFFTGSAIACFGGMILAFGLAAFKHRAPLSRYVQALPVLAVALWPILWCCVMKNHVRLHFWMTNKQLSVSVFAVCAYLAATWLPRANPTATLER